jgi:hypothetical protein
MFLRRLYHSRSHLKRWFSLYGTPKNDKKKTLYLHIGLGKTGTTALQEFFWSNRKQLSEFGIDYPDYAVIAGAHHVVSPHQPNFLQAIPFQPVEKWAPEIAKSEQQNILLSSELIAWTAADLVGHYCEHLLQYFELKVIIYIRRQDDQIMAAYNQQVKAGVQKKKVHEVMEKMIKRFDFKERIAVWEKYVGRSNILIRPYERKQFHEQDIRWDFLYSVFQINDYSRFQLSEKNTNPRLSFTSLEYKRLLNQLFDDAEQSNLFNDILLQFSAETDKNSTKIYSENALLSPELRAEILEKFDEYNTYLSERYRLGEKLFLDPVPTGAKEDWKPIEFKETDLQTITAYIQAHAPSLYTRLNKALDKLPAQEQSSFKPLSLN